LFFLGKLQRKQKTRATSFYVKYFCNCRAYLMDIYLRQDNLNNCFLHSLPPPTETNFPPFAPSINPIHRQHIDETFPAAKYTCPFGEEKHSAVSLRVQSRKTRRTPVNIVEMPRPRSRPRRDVASASEPPFQLFFSLPNTPDTENPIYLERRRRNVNVIPTLIPGIGTESYI